MKEYLLDLRDAIARFGRDPAQIFAPGLSRVYIEDRLSELPYRVSDDAVDLFEFANGSDPGFDILPGVYLESLESAIHTSLIEYDLGEFDDEPFSFSLRFLADGSSGGYGFGQIDSPSKGQIIDYRIHARRCIAFSNLERLVLTAIECLRNDIYPREGEEESAFTRFYALAAKLNPEHDWSFEE